MSDELADLMENINAINKMKKESFNDFVHLSNIYESFRKNYFKLK